MTPSQPFAPPPQNVGGPPPAQFPGAAPASPPRPAAAPAVFPGQPRTVRGQSPDEPSDTRPPPAPRALVLELPPPEQLGIAPVRPAAADIDWAAAHRRLDQLGATFTLEKLPTGDSHVICLLPTAQAGHHQRIDVQAASSAEAVRLALEKVEVWTGGKR